MKSTLLWVAGSNVWNTRTSRKGVCRKKKGDGLEYEKTKRRGHNEQGLVFD